MATTEATSIASQAKVIGLIIPPPDIRAVVDKTAQFVAKNGKNFEQRILNSEEGKTAKFNFMKPFDPYHAYYEMKIRHFEEGKETAVSASSKSIQDAPSLPTSISVPSSSSAAASVSSELPGQKTVISSARASMINPIARILLDKDSMYADSPPAAHEYTMKSPYGTTPIDVEIIKLSAIYTAVNGKDFLGGLAQREQRNPQFDFIKPTHILFSYFTNLVDVYGKILANHKSFSSTNPAPFQVALEERMVKQAALEASVWRWKHLNDEREQRAHRDMAESERMAYLGIDWHDFSIVETINFDDGADTGLVSSASTAATSNITSSTFGLGPAVANVAIDKAQGNSMDTDAEERIRVVDQYQPRLNPGVSAQHTLIDPISGQAVPVDKMEEHMRVQLLDPRWRVEQKKFQDKQKETGLASAGAISENLRVFAQNRGDIFDANAAGQSSAAAPAAPAAISVPAPDPSPATFMAMQYPPQLPPQYQYQQQQHYTQQPNYNQQHYNYNQQLQQQGMFPPQPAFQQPFLPPLPLAQPTYPASGGQGPSLLSAPPSEPTANPTNDPHEPLAKRSRGVPMLLVQTPSQGGLSNATWNGSPGQVLQMSVGSEGTVGGHTTIKEIKEMISAQLNGMPLSKMQLKGAEGFAKDTDTISKLGLEQGGSLTLSEKSRGGKR